MKKRGIWIAFLGVDGSGKTSIIRELSQSLKAQFDRIDVFHFRPFYGLKKGQGHTVTHPHEQIPRSAVVSFLKVLYYLLDYWISYALFLRRHLKKNSLLLFDRYIDDLLIDPRRYRYGGSKKLLKKLLFLFPKPDMVFILDLSAEEAMKRKSEIEWTELQQLLNQYRSLEKQLPSGILIRTDRPLPEIIHPLNQIIHHQQAQRKKKARVFVLYPILKKLLKFYYPPGTRLSYQSPDKYDVDELYLLPGRIGLRWLFSSNRAARENIFKGWTPFSASSKIFWRFLQGLNTFHLFSRIPFIQRIPISIPKDASWRHLSWQAYTPPLFSLSIGSNTQSYKAILYLSDRQTGEIHSVLKLALSDFAKQSILYEATVLQRLSQEGFQHHPELLYVHPQGHFQIQRFIGREYASLKIEWQHMQCLEALHQSHQYMAIPQFILSHQENLMPSFFPDSWKALIQKALDYLLKNPREVFCVQEHGDFAPWNIRRHPVSHHLLLVDWDNYLPLSLPLQDIFHFYFMLNYLFHSPHHVRLKSIREEPVIAQYCKQHHIDESLFDQLGLVYLLKEIAHHDKRDPYYLKYILHHLQTTLSLL